MTKRGARTALLFVLALAQANFFGACWDNRELDSLAIVTGIALDETQDNPNMTDLTLQIRKVMPLGTKSDDGGGTSQEQVILVKASDTSVWGAIGELDRASSKHILLDHNQVLLLGTSLAEAGLRDRIDFFLRARDARLEVPVMVADGRAEEILKAKPEQDPSSAMFLALAVRDTERYEVRIIDLVFKLLDKNSSLVIPIASLEKEDGKDRIRLSGMAVIKDDKMVGRLSEKQSMGYTWTTGCVRRGEFSAESDAGRASFDITNQNLNRKVELREDGGVKVTLSLHSVLSLTELRGFSGLSASEVVERLKKMAEAEIGATVLEAFEAARALDADIFEFSRAVREKYRKEWEFMSPEWDSLFADIDFAVKVEAHILSVGQTTQSLEMKEGAS